VIGKTGIRDSFKGHKNERCQENCKVVSTGVEPYGAVGDDWDHRRAAGAKWLSRKSSYNIQGANFVRLERTKKKRVKNGKKGRCNKKARSGCGEM